jgi:hypothetical protein
MRGNWVTSVVQTWVDQGQDEAWVVERMLVVVVVLEVEVGSSVPSSGESPLMTRVASHLL